MNTICCQLLGYSIQQNLCLALQASHGDGYIHIMCYKNRLQNNTLFYLYSVHSSGCVSDNTQQLCVQVFL